MARAAHSSSGLTFSAAFGVRDANEASWTQVLEGVEFMADAVGIPDAEYVRGLSRRGGAHMASIRAALNSVDKFHEVGWRFVCGFRAKAESRKATRSAATTA